MTYSRASQVYSKAFDKIYYAILIVTIGRFTSEQFGTPRIVLCLKQGDVLEIRFPTPRHAGTGLMAMSPMSSLAARLLTLYA
jgi:hypothetical protein